MFWYKWNSLNQQPGLLSECQFGPFSCVDDNASFIVLCVYVEASKPVFRKSSFIITIDPALNIELSPFAIPEYIKSFSSAMTGRDRVIAFSSNEIKHSK